MHTPWRGVFVIPPTPFDARDELDVVDLASCVRFCLEAGAHGIVAPVNASEFAYLSDVERRTVAEVVIHETGGAIPVVVGVTASTAREAAALARHASDAGADAVIAMPPHVQRASVAEIHTFYRAIDAAAGVPVFLQNYGGPGGTPMSAALMTELLRDLPHVLYVKEETEFSSQLVSETIELAGNDLLGVMGGKAGRHLLDEYRRGVCGTMPACEVTDVHVRLWNTLESGDDVASRELYRQLLPLLLFETTYGVAVYKEVLARRGVMRNTAHRQAGGKGLDPWAMAELDSILADLRPLMTSHPTGA